MKNVFTHKIGKREFNIVWDRDEILKQIEVERTTFEHNTFHAYQTREDEDILTESKFNENLDDMVKLLDEITTEERLIGFIENAQKKKNGTFYKGRIAFREGCGNTIYITEWNNTWIYNAINISADDDLNLSISYRTIVDTP